MASRNGTWKIIATIGTFVVVALGAAVAYGIMKGSLTKDIERTHEEVDAVCAEVNDMKPKVEKNALNNAEVNKDIYYMQQDIEDIKEDSEDIKQGVDVIKGMIEKLGKE